MIEILLFATIINHCFSTDSSSAVPICSDLTILNGSKWADSNGWDCDAYSADEDYCSRFGDLYPNGGYTAN